jgi:hypothetical protein
MQPAGRTYISIKFKIIFNLYLAMINVSKVALFKPNGANYIDEDTNINSEQVNTIKLITEKKVLVFLL